MASGQLVWRTAGLSHRLGPDAFGARARQRAHGVMGQLRRFLVQPSAPSTGHDTGHAVLNTGNAANAGHTAPATAAAPASKALVHALAAHRVSAETYYSTVGT